MALRILLSIFACVVTTAIARPALATSQADVTVVVDTSTSMKDPGYDPERTSLLVTKLLTDVVPGRLAVVRLLSLGVADPSLFPAKPTGRTIPCEDDPTQGCMQVEATTDWGELARLSPQKYGLLERPRRADGGFKAQLDAHLDQNASNSMFDIAFRASQGAFEQQSEPIPQTLIWLSDGRTKNEPGLKQSIRDLQADGVAIEAVLFGRGDPRLAEEAGLPTQVTSNPAELMKAFAGVFRRIMRAPFEQDGVVANRPDFEMKPNVDEAWVVIYGDITLSNAWLEGSTGKVQTDFAHDSLQRAGAYRVAHMTSPSAGQYTVHVQGGGPGAAFAVVQLADLMPVLLEPKEAVSGSEISLVGGIRSGTTGKLLTHPSIVDELTLSAKVDGQTVELTQVGSGTGKRSAPHTFSQMGPVPVEVCVKSDLVDRCAEEIVQVSGHFKYSGGPLHLDLGTLNEDSESCRPLVFEAEHQGNLRFVLKELRSTPTGHHLEVRVPNGVLEPGGQPVSVAPQEGWQVCLVTAKRTPSSSSNDELRLAIHLADSDVPHHHLDVHLTWQVDGLSWLERWLWLILTILSLAIAAFVIYGFIWPRRFPSGLALAIAADLEDLEEQQPQPITQWRGIGIGWYRNARAYLTSSYRLSKNKAGAVARLQMDRATGLQVFPEAGSELLYETLDGDWKPVALEGRRGRAGHIFRVGSLDEGILFRISLSRLTPGPPGSVGRDSSTG
ncbi:MAG: hypothetical protein HN348_26045, partial [Proteobacteria bacterium]|nr:hypothetical protein [Pseudomonadota bacterium]